MGLLIHSSFFKYLVGFILFQIVNLRGWLLLFNSLNILNTSQVFKLSSFKSALCLFIPHVLQFFATQIFSFS